MNIDELTQEQKIEFCRAMAVQGFYEETDSAYSNALDFLNIPQPLDEKFSYTDGIGEELYRQVEDAMTETLYLQLLFAAIFDPEKFDDFAHRNRGYELAISMLEDVESFESEEEFEEFIDSIKDA